MTLQEISELPYVRIENIEDKYNHLWVEDDHYLTDYVDSEDIKNYNGFNDAFFPLSGDMFPEYRTITGDEHREYERRRDEAIDPQPEPDAE